MTHTSPSSPANKSLAVKKLLLIDDEEDSLFLLKKVIGDHYSLAFAPNAEEGIKAARTVQPDLILLDLVMPGTDGVAACHALRSNEATRHIPVVMLTGDNSEEQRIRSFEVGADDFISKPFKVKELVARIKSKLRRLEERNGGDALVCGNLTMNLRNLEVTLEGKLVPLSVLEFNLLRFFVQNPERLVSREKILEAVWRDSVVSFRTVDTHMVSLRKKLKGFDHTIATIYSAGYVLKKSSVEL